MSSLRATVCTEKCEHKKLATTMHLMNNMRKEGSLCDVVLVVQGQHFSAHRAVLATGSEFFRLMFSTAMIESKSREVELGDIDPNTIELLLEFIYSARISINSSNVMSLLIASNQYLIKPVKEMCEGFLKGEVDAENCLELFVIADYFACQELKAVAEDFLPWHFTYLYKQNTFLQLDLTKVVYLLHQDKLCVQSETQIYDAAMRWIKYDIVNRQQYLAEVLKCVRYSFVSKTFLSTIVLSDPLIRDNPECLRIVSRDGAQDQVGHQQTSEQNNQFLRQYSVIGVFEENQILLQQCFFEPKNCKWAKLRREEFNAKSISLPIVSCDDALYIMGGKMSKILDCQMRCTSHRKRDFLAACGSKEKIYTSGGTVGNITVTSFECYDTETKLWEKLPTMLSSRCSHGSVAANGLIYVCGGAYKRQETSKILKLCEVYDPSTQKWSQLCSMNTSRMNHGLVAVKKRLYALGGQGKKGALNSVEYYDISSNKWHYASPMPWRGVGLKCIAVGRIIYVLAGTIFEKDSCFQHVLEYHTHSDKWIICKAKAVPHSDFALCLVNIPVIDPNDF